MAQLRGDEALGIHGPRPSGSASHTHTQAQKQALAGYYHASSTDADPKHSECPIGPDPYCFYNKALAEGRTPPSHNDMKVRFELEPRLRQSILAIYLDLTRTDLLRRCLKGKTQNPNESFHSKMNKLSKTKFVSLPTARYSIAEAVFQHNNGYERSAIASQYVPSTIQYLKKMDKERTRKSLSPAHIKKKPRYDEMSADYAAGSF